MNDHQADRATSDGSLWLQGGTPNYPQLDNLYPGKYAFAALRCAIDNLNGDNVEWVGYPNADDGTRAHHVFCWAYYINPRPDFGTVTIRKTVTPAESAGTDFSFASDLTYNSDGKFVLSADGTTSGEQSFDRADSDSFGKPYVTTEDIPEGWQLTGLSCTQTGTGDNASTITADLDTGRVSIGLAAGDNVTCTYTNKLLARPGLRVSKITQNDKGGPFDFTIDGPNGFHETPTVTTTSAGDAELFFEREPNAPGLDAGRVHDSRDSAGADSFRSLGVRHGIVRRERGASPPR